MECHDLLEHPDESGLEASRATQRSAKTRGHASETWRAIPAHRVTRLSCSCRDGSIARPGPGPARLCCQRQRRDNASAGRFGERCGDTESDPGTRGPCERKPATGPIDWLMSNLIRKLAWSKLSEPRIAIAISGVGLLLGMVVGATAQNARRCRSGCRCRICCPRSSTNPSSRRCCSTPGTYSPA